MGIFRKHPALGLPKFWNPQYGQQETSGGQLASPKQKNHQLLNLEELHQGQCGVECSQRRGHRGGLFCDIEQQGFDQHGDSAYLTIWGFPEIGVPPDIIHF